MIGLTQIFDSEETLARYHQAKRRSTLLTTWVYWEGANYAINCF